MQGHHRRRGTPAGVGHRRLLLPTSAHPVFSPACYAVGEVNTRPYALTEEEVAQQHPVAADLRSPRFLCKLRRLLHPVTLKASTDLQECKLIAPKTLCLSFVSTTVVCRLNDTDLNECMLIKT